MAAAEVAAMASSVLSSRFIHFSFSPSSSPSYSSSSSLSAFRLPHQIHSAPPLRRRRRRRRRMNAFSTGDSETTRRDGSEETEAEEAENVEEDGAEGQDAGFEDRLAKLQRRRSGKKAEKRKALKGNSSYASSSSSSTAGKGNVLLPPVTLEDPVSDGLPVELGFNSYTERINGRFAALGLAAILLIELSTGQSFLKFHDSSILTVQVYFLLSCSALFIKYEKEKISVWPKN